MLEYKIFSASKKISHERPVLVLVHGLGGGHFNWLYQVRHLKNKYDIISIELPSHEKSTVKMSELAPNLDAISEKIIEVLDHLKIEKATFTGLSLGTLIIKNLVFRYPDRVDKYILIGAIGKISFLFNLSIHLTLFLLPIVPLKILIWIVCHIFMPFKRLSYGRSLFYQCAQRVEKDEFKVWLKAILSYKDMQREYAQTMGEESNGLYIMGELDYFFLSLITKDRKRIKNFAIVQDAGHLCNIDQHKTANQLIIDFQDTGTVDAPDRILTY